MTSIEAVLPASGGIAIFVSATDVVLASTRARRVGRGVGVAAPDAAGADAAGLGLAVRAGEAEGVATASGDGDADGAAVEPPHETTMSPPTRNARRAELRITSTPTPRAWPEATPPVAPDKGQCVVSPVERRVERSAQVGGLVGLESRVEGVCRLAERRGECGAPLDARADGLTPRAQRQRAVRREQPVDREVGDAVRVRVARPLRLELLERRMRGRGHELTLREGVHVRLWDEAIRHERAVPERLGRPFRQPARPEHAGVPAALALPDVHVLVRRELLALRVAGPRVGTRPARHPPPAVAPNTSHPFKM